MNLVGLPLLARTGGADDNVPPLHSRRLVRLVNEHSGSTSAARCVLTTHATDSRRSLWTHVGECAPPAYDAALCAGCRKCPGHRTILMA